MSIKDESSTPATTAIPQESLKSEALHIEQAKMDNLGMTRAEQIAANPALDSAPMEVDETSTCCSESCSMGRLQVRRVHRGQRREGAAGRAQRRKRQRRAAIRLQARRASHRAAVRRAARRAARLHDFERGLASRRSAGHGQPPRRRPRHSGSGQRQWHHRRCCIHLRARHRGRRSSASRPESSKSTSQKSPITQISIFVASRRRSPRKRFGAIDLFSRSRPSAQRNRAAE